MNDDVLVSLGRQFLTSTLEKEGLIRRVQQLETELAEAKKVIEIHEGKKATN